MANTVKFALSSGAVLLSSMTVAWAGSNYEAGPTIGDNGWAAGLILLLGIAVIMGSKSFRGGSASDKRKDQAADEE